MKGRPLAAHPVAVERSRRQIEIGRRAPRVQETTVILAHAAVPFWYQDACGETCLPGRQCKFRLTRHIPFPRAKFASELDGRGHNALRQRKRLARFQQSRRIHPKARDYTPNPGQPLPHPARDTTGPRLHKIPHTRAATAGGSGESAPAAQGFAG